MTCADFESRLSAYLDGELPRWKRWKVQNHLRHCAECADLMQDLEAVDSAFLGSAQENPAPEYLTSAVMRRLPAMPPAWRPNVMPRPWTAGLVLAGMQVVALCGAYWWGFNQGTDVKQPTGAATVGTISSAPIPLPSRPQTNGAPDSPGAAGGVWARTREGLSAPAPTSFDDGRPSPAAPSRQPRRPFVSPVLQPSGAR